MRCASLATGWMGLMLLAALPAAAQSREPVEALLQRGRVAGADTVLIGRVRKRAHEAGLAPRETAALLRPGIRLAEDDLPTRESFLKALEGLAKNVPPARIATVLQQLRRRTQQAGALIDGWLRPSDPSSSARHRLIAYAAQAAGQGVPEATLRDFLNRLPQQTRRSHGSAAKVAVALQVLPTLAKIARQPQQAAEVAAAALAAGFDAAALRQLPAAFRSGRQRAGRSEQALMKRFKRDLSQGGSPSQMLDRLRSDDSPSPPRDRRFR